MNFLRHPRLPGRLRVRHLVVVAGPSGAGKSTFLASLAAEKLPEAVAERLPSGAGDWPQTNGRRVVRGRLACDGAGAVEGLVLHYDIMRPFETPLADYAEDSDLALLKDAERVTLVNLWAPGETLAARLAGRPPRRRLLPVFRAALRRLLGKSGVYWGVDEAERHRRLVARYRDPAFLITWEERWERFVTAGLGARLQRTVALEAGEAAPDGTGYRVLAPSSRTDEPADASLKTPASTSRL